MLKMRQIHIVSAPVMEAHILYDGKRLNLNRKEFRDLDVLLDSLPTILKNFNPNKMEVYVEGYKGEEYSRIRDKLESTFRKVTYGDSGVN